jgi:hypothetical protein
VSLGVTAFVVLLLLGLTATATIGVRTHLKDGRADLQAGRGAVSAGDLEGAARLFTEAGHAFDQADSGTRQGIAGILGTLPILGRNLDVASGLAQAGSELAAAGVDLADAMNTLPDGLGSLAPDKGAIPLDAVVAMQTATDSAAGHAEIARTIVNATPSSLLVSPVADARFLAVRQVDSAASALRSASLLLKGLPGFAGADGPRRYFFVAESPAELRGTGGIWGAWSILTVERGRFSFSPFKPIESLRDLPADQVPPPNPDYRRNYDQYCGAGFWRDMNMTPDFPSAARAVLSSYEILKGQKLDGVISADPFALKDLLEVTGPTKVPGLGITVSAGTVVPFMTNEAYIRYASQADERKAVLGQVAGSAFQEFLSMDEHKIGRLHAIGDAVAGGHLKIYSTDPDLQDGLALAHADGAFVTPPGDDLLSVVVNSRSGSKIDYYASRTIDYDVQLGGDHEAFATTTVDIRNGAPKGGLPDHVVDPFSPGNPGDNISLTTFSCRAPCSLVSATRDGKQVKMRVGSELGFPWYQDFSTIPAGRARQLKVITRLENAWTGDSSAGEYRLTFLNQTTVDPTKVRIAIHAPEGTRITWTSQSMAVDGGTAVWTGIPGPRLSLDIRFAAPFPLSLWRDMIRPLQ